MADKCGACQHINEPYDVQLTRKNDRIAALFTPLFEANAHEFISASSSSKELRSPTLTPDEPPSDAITASAQSVADIRPILGMDEPYFYRNRVISPFAPGRLLQTSNSVVQQNECLNKRTASYRNNSRTNYRNANNACANSQHARREILCGMYAAGTHDLVATDECLVENRQAKAVILTIRELMPRFDIEPYNETTNSGFLRHVAVRVGHESGEVLVTLVTNGENFPTHKAFCRELVRRCPFITTIVQNINEEITNVILGDQEQCLYGPGFILDRLCNLSFRISSQSFYQTNPVQAEVLYRTAIDFAAFTGCETVVDAYCGTGTIGLVAARSGAARVIGVDTTASAIEDAFENARHNGIKNATFEVADAGEYMLEVAATHKTVDVLLMDPPRAGASEQFLDAAAKLAPKRIVYISCNPETQVRDIAQLQQEGFSLITVQPVDMFPHTDHIETVALLMPTAHR